MTPAPSLAKSCIVSLSCALLAVLCGCGSSEDAAPLNTVLAVESSSDPAGSGPSQDESTVLAEVSTDSAQTASPGRSVPVDREPGGKVPAGTVHLVTVHRLNNDTAPGIPVYALPEKTPPPQLISRDMAAPVALSDERGMARVPCPKDTRPGVVIFGGEDAVAGRAGSDRIHLPGVGHIALRVVEKLRGEAEQEASAGDAGPSAEEPPTLLASSIKVRLLRLNGKDKQIETCELFTVERGAWRTNTAAIGERFRLRVESEEFRGSVDFAGPKIDGDLASVTLEVERSARLILRLVDPGGSPIARRKIKVTLRGMGGTYGPLRSSSAGVVAVPLRQRAGLELREVAVRASSLPKKSLRGETIFAETVSRTSSHASLDIGRVVMHPPSVLVSGHVVDGDGEPVRRALVSLVSPDAGVRSPLETGTVGAKEWPSPGEPLSCRSGADGAFELLCFGDPSDDGARTLSLFAHRRDQMAAADVPFQPGDEDARIVLGSAGRLLVDTTPFSRRQLSSMQLFLDSSQSGFQARRIAAGEEKWFERLVPGEYFVRLQMDGHRIVVADNLVLASGQDLVDSRLAPLQLDHLVEWRRFQLSGPGAESVRTVYIDRGGDVSEEQSTIQLDFARPQSLVAVDGVFTFAALIHEKREDGWAIEVPGYRRIQLPEIEDGAVIELSPGIEIDLRLVGGTIPLDGLVGEIRAPDNHRFRPSGSRVRFDADGRGSFLASKEGMHTLFLSASRSRTTEEVVAPWGGATFEVSAKGGTVEILPVRER